MTKKSLLDRLWFKEVIGEITEKDFGYVGIAHHPVTLYSIKDEIGNVYFGALSGHHSTSKAGDNVEVYLVRSSLLAVESLLKPLQGEESEIAQYKPHKKRWKEIKSCRALKPEENFEKGSEDTKRVRTKK